MECVSRIAEQRDPVSYPLVDLDEAGREIGHPCPCRHRPEGFFQLGSRLGHFAPKPFDALLLQIVKTSLADTVEEVARVRARRHYPEHLPRRLVLSSPILQFSRGSD